MAIFDEYNELFPVFASSSFSNSVTIDEQESSSASCKVRHAKFKNVSGEFIPHEAVLKFRTLYDTAGSMELLTKNCDGVFCCLDGDALILNMCELKTTALDTAILEAKKQITCTSTQLRALLNHVKTYDGNVKVRGFLVAHKPKIAQMSMLKQPQKESDRRTIKLLKEGCEIMQKSKLEEMWSPLKMVDIKLYYIEVPQGKDTVNIDYSKII